MLNRKNRLTKNRHFQYIYRKGSKVYSKNLYLVYAPTKIKPCKIGVVVSNKVGKAVKRNKIKRIIRETMREVLPNLNNSNNYVIVAKPEIITVDFEQIRKEIYSVLKKGKFLNE